ncbi:MAG: DNA sulfur modification protein DndD, partial [Syntrophaceae bacterium]|nr:DNA sulfur modification protein DndD [Syntrophaceae bacterium]
MIFEEITLENFATYKGHHSISLSPSSPDKPVILIGGENGCGKTTLLDAFQLVLFGAAAQCSNRGKLPYETYLERCINRDTPPEDGASIKLAFHFYYAGEKKSYRIERVWFRKGKKIQEQFWAYHMVNGDLKYERTLSDNWLDYVESFFPSQVAPFFLFDGEKIESLADFEKSGHLIHSAIQSLLGLNLVNQLDSDLQLLEKRKYKELASTEENNKLDSLENEISAIRIRISELRTDELKLKDKINQNNKQLESVDLLFRQEGGDLYIKRASLEEKFTYRQKELSNYENRLRDIAAGSVPLLMVQHLLEGIRYQADIEEKAHREQLICKSLLERDQSILSILSSGYAAPNLISEVTNFLNDDIERRSKAASVDCYLNLGNDGVQSLRSLLDNELPALSSTIPQELATLNELRNDVESL